MLSPRVVVINFWGVWCGPCVREAPGIQKFAEKYRDHADVAFLTVSNDTNPDTTRDWMKENGYDFPVLLDEGLGRRANIRGYPTTLFIDRDGRMAFEAGGAPEDRLVEEFSWRVDVLLGVAVAQ